MADDILMDDGPGTINNALSGTTNNPLSGLTDNELLTGPHKEVTLAEEEELLNGELEKTAEQEKEQEILAGTAFPVKERSIEEIKEKERKLQRELDKANDELDQIKRERAVDRHELEQWQKRDLERTSRTAAVLKREKDARDALAASFRGSDINVAREWRKENDLDANRAAIDCLSSLHPDFSCEPCGKRLASGMFKKENMGDVGRLYFTNLRELAAIIDLKDEWNELTASEANRAVREKIHSGEISSRAYRTAYVKGLCTHAIEEANDLANSGVTISGESKALSDIVSEVIGGTKNRLYKKNCVVLLPEDSSVAKCNGEWKELEVLKYKDWDGLKSSILSMEKSGSLPKSLWVVLKSTFAKANLEELKSYCGRISEDAAITTYISADVLPVAPVDLKTETIKTHQEFLTSWRLEKPEKNIIVISPISGMIWSVYPFVFLYTVSGRETKELFEKAVAYIVDGKSFPIDSAIDHPSTGKKRPAPSPWEPTDSTLRGRKKKTFRCTNCGMFGHLADRCYQDKKSLE